MSVVCTESNFGVEVCTHRSDLMAHYILRRCRGLQWKRKSIFKIRFSIHFEFNKDLPPEIQSIIRKYRTDNCVNSISMKLNTLMLNVPFRHNVTNCLCKSTMLGKSEIKNSNSFYSGPGMSERVSCEFLTFSNFRHFNGLRQKW